MPGQQPKTVKAECYLTVQPTYSEWGKDDQGRPILNGARITGVTKNRPDKQVRSGTVVTKVTLEIEASALLPLLPQAEIYISASDTETILARAEDPAYPPPPPEDEELMDT